MKDKGDNYKRSFSISTLLAWQKIYRFFDLFLSGTTLFVTFVQIIFLQKTFFLLEDTQMFFI